VKAYYEQDGIVIYHADCREVLPELREVHLVATDPPYNGVLEDDWDNQWASDAEFLSWLDGIAVDLDAALADNGTLYLFSTPRLAASVELQIAARFTVIGNAVWDKGDGRKGAAGSGIDVTSLRTYWASDTERVVIAEKRNNAAYQTADEKAREACGFWAACEAGKRSVFGDYLRGEFARAEVTNKQIAALFPSRTGGLTGCVSNWLLGMNIPTPEQYATMRAHLNQAGGGDYLRREYDDLRREYDDLRREYDDLRRPFFPQPFHQWGSVWRFPIERERDHPAQKPLALMGQIVAISSRPGDLVLDPFMGSGTTLVAAKRAGRKAIGIEREEKYCEAAANRLAQGALPLEVAG
jgi:adenine-specific DNA-methyltransferase